MHQLNGIDVHQLRSYVATVAQDPAPPTVTRWSWRAGSALIEQR